MENFDNCQLIPLTNEELKETEGGFLLILLATAQTYALVCGLAYIAGRTAAFIEINCK